MADPFRNYCRIQHLSFTTPVHPAANGQVERANTGISNYRKAFMSLSNSRFWVTILADAEFAINQAVFRPTHFSPFFAKTKGIILVLLSLRSRSTLLFGFTLWIPTTSPTSFTTACTISFSRLRNLTPLQFSPSPVKKALIQRPKLAWHWKVPLRRSATLCL